MAVVATSAIISVDTRTVPKIVILPPAASNIGKVFTVIDPYGTADINPITIRAYSGPPDDTIDQNISPIVLSRAFQSISFFGQSSTNYSILSNGLNNGFWVVIT